MKKTIVVSIMCLLLSTALKAQDVITLKSGQEIKAKIVEVLSGTIRYRKATALDGPIYTINKSEVRYITYENGEVEQIKRSKKSHSSNDSYDDFPEGKFALFGGLNFIPIQSKQFSSFDISDWENFGLKKYDPSSAEGRVYVPLSETNANGYKGGLFLGLGYRITQPVRISVEYQSNFSRALTVSGFYLGLTYFPSVQEKFKLGIDAKIGSLSATVQYGDIKLISNYTPPVIITQGVFSNGDTITARMKGTSFQLSIKPTFKISDNSDFFVNLGYISSFASSTHIYIKTNFGGSRQQIDLNMNDPALVKPDGGNAQININPTLSSKGLFFQTGFTFKIGE